MTIKKVVSKTDKPLVQPFEVGYKFPVEAEIIGVSDDLLDEFPYLVNVNLSSEWDTSYAETRFSKEELVDLISKGTPSFKKVYITQQIKEAKALVASLEKQLTEV